MCISPIIDVGPYIELLYQQRTGGKKEHQGKQGTKKQRNETDRDTGQQVFNEKRDKELAKLLLANWGKSQKSLIAKLPEFYKGDRSKQRCMYFDVKGVCKSSCERSHTPTNNSDYRKLWDTCKVISDS